ncbi:MAG: DUF362 domain-containing protein, partial [Treponema sp.]|nr:DUF362 domain-containing protein [Treponema sp.]
TEAVALAGGLDGIVKYGDTVVLKPNIIVTNYSWGYGPTIPETVNGVCTDWRVVQATAELVRKIVGPKGTAGAGKILVIEGSGNGSTSVNFINVGYTPANLSAVDEIIALDNEGAWVEAGNPDGGSVTRVALDNFLYKTASGAYTAYYKNDGVYYVNTKMYEADALICLPALKNHWDAVVTGSIKNIAIGASPPSVYGINNSTIGRNNMVNHSSINFHDWIADYFSCMPADFVIMDGLQGLENGPLPGGANLAPSQKNMRCILASKDALALDTVETNIINWDYTTVRYLTYLTERGQVGTNPKKPKITIRGNPQNITVLGNIKVDDIRTNFNGNLPMSGGDKLTAAQLAKPTLSITQAAFSGQNLNLTLDISPDTVKIDIYIDDIFAGSVNKDMEHIILSAAALSGGSHTIELRSYTQYMCHATASTTAVKL